MDFSIVGIVDWWDNIRSEKSYNTGYVDGADHAEAVLDNDDYEEGFQDGYDERINTD